MSKQTSSRTRNRCLRLSKEAFPLNKYGRVLSIGRPLQPVNAPRRLDRTVAFPACFHPHSAVPPLAPPGGQQSLSGPVVIVRGATGGRVHVSRGWVHVVVVCVSSDTG